MSQANKKEPQDLVLASSSSSSTLFPNEPPLVSADDSGTKPHSESGAVAHVGAPVSLTPEALEDLLARAVARGRADAGGSADGGSPDAPSSYSSFGLRPWSNYVSSLGMIDERLKEVQSLDPSHAQFALHYTADLERQNPEWSYVRRFDDIRSRFLRAAGCFTERFVSGQLIEDADKSGRIHDTQRYEEKLKAVKKKFYLRATSDPPTIDAVTAIWARTIFRGGAYPLFMLEELLDADTSRSWAGSHNLMHLLEVPSDIQYREAKTYASLSFPLFEDYDTVLERVNLAMLDAANVSAISGDSGECSNSPRRFARARDIYPSSSRNCKDFCFGGAPWMPAVSNADNSEAVDAQSKENDELENSRRRLEEEVIQLKTRVLQQETQITQLCHLLASNNNNNNNKSTKKTNSGRHIDAMDGDNYSYKSSSSSTSVRSDQRESGTSDRDATSEAADEGVYPFASREPSTRKQATTKTEARSPRRHRPQGGSHAVYDEAGDDEGAVKYSTTMQTTTKPKSSSPQRSRPRSSHDEAPNDEAVYDKTLPDQETAKYRFTTFNSEPLQFGKPRPSATDQSSLNALNSESRGLPSFARFELDLAKQYSTMLQAATEPQPTSARRNTSKQTTTKPQSRSPQRSRPEPRHSHEEFFDEAPAKQPTSKRQPSRPRQSHDQAVQDKADHNKVASKHSKAKHSVTKQTTTTPQPSTARRSTSRPGPSQAGHDAMEL